MSVPAIILCGGRGSRMGDRSGLEPKALTPIGHRPILWHVMKIIATHGTTDFVLALGWLGDHVRRWVLDYDALAGDFTVELGQKGIDALEPHGETGWRVTCAETGLDAGTGSRVRRAVRRAPGDGPVLVTYADGLGDVDVTTLVKFHQGHGKLATVTAVRPPGRFGELSLDGERVTAFEEKPAAGAGYVNGGFLVLEREAIERYIPETEDVALEREPLSRIAADGQLRAWRHDGFWQSMDTPRERRILQDLWASGDPPWRIW